MISYFSIIRIRSCTTTFAISWYLIFYLQVKQIRPHDLLKLENRSSKIVAGKILYLEN